MHDLVFATGSELAAAIRERRVSAVEVLEAHLAQIARHNPALNAIVTLDEEGATRRAHEADAALARGELWGPLHGVPMTLKDGHSTAGMRTTSGLPELADYVPVVDGTAVARLKTAGAIILGKTNVPVLLDGVQTANPIFGRTNNPWDLQRTPGGSSGGASAALAAGLTPLEVGSDIGGSIRIPAHFCGVFGLKTTEHRVSGYGFVPGRETPRSVRIMAVLGPMARSVDDLALLFRIVAGCDGRATEVPPVPVLDVPKLSLKDLRMAWAPTFPAAPVSGDTLAAVERLASELARLGVIIEEALPAVDFEEQHQIRVQLRDMMHAISRGQEEPKQPLLSDYLALLHRRDYFIRAWDRFFQEWDALLCPAAMIAAFPHCEPGAPLPVDGEMVEYRAIGRHTTPFNFTGHPAVVLPFAKDHDGLPIGTQVVSQRWHDEKLLGIAMQLSEITGPFHRPPGY